METRPVVRIRLSWSTLLGARWEKGGREEAVFVGVDRRR